MKLGLKRLSHKSLVSSKILIAISTLRNAIWIYIYRINQMSSQPYEVYSCQLYGFTQRFDSNREFLFLLNSFSSYKTAVANIGSHWTLKFTDNFQKLHFFGSQRIKGLMLIRSFTTIKVSNYSSGSMRQPILVIYLLFEIQLIGLNRCESILCQFSLRSDGIGKFY